MATVDGAGRDDNLCGTYTYYDVESMPSKKLDTNAKYICIASGDPEWLLRLLCNVCGERRATPVVCAKSRTRTNIVGLAAAEIQFQLQPQAS
jgi:hypothetical protein